MGKLKCRQRSTIKKRAISNTLLTFAFQCRWRSKRGPQRLSAAVARGRHVEGDLDELVALEDDTGALPVLERLDGGSGVVVRLAGLTLTSIEHLKDKQSDITLKLFEIKM